MTMYYKVVRRRNLKLVSSTPCKGGELTYHRKTFTRMIPGSLGIFIFKDLWLATQFAKGHHIRTGTSMKVYSVAIKGKPVRARRVQSIDFSVASFVEMFKRNATRYSRFIGLASKAQDGRVSRVAVAPHGAYTVQAVRLKRQVANFGGYW